MNLYFLYFFIFDYDNYLININENVFRLVEIDDAQKKFVDKFQISFFRECFCDAIDMNVFVHKFIYLFFRCFAIDAHQNFFF